MPANQDLLVALQNRDFEAAQAALDAGADLNAPVPSLRTPSLFHYYMTRQGLEEARWLYERGANVQVLDEKGESVLMKAIQHRRRDEFEMALEMGVDINQTNLRGVSPVLRAVLVDSKGYFLERLLEKGADPSIASQVGTTALLAATSAGHLEMVNALFDAGADPRGLDEFGQNILYSAVLSGDARMVKLVLDRTKEYRKSGEIDINHAAANHSEPIAKAAQIHPEMVLMLLREGANPNAQSKNKLERGLSPLMLLALADEDGEATLTREALSYGANPLLRDHEGYNAFFFAVQKGLNGKSAVLQALIDAGLDPATPIGPSGFSPLHVAISSDLPEDEFGNPIGPSREQIVEKMLGMGFPSLPKAWEPPDQDKKPDRLPAPLILALMQKEMEVARVILEKGTPLNELDSDGLSVLHHLAPFSGMTKEEAIAVQFTQQQLEAFDKKNASQGKEGQQAPSEIKQKAAQAREKVEEVEKQAREQVAMVASWISEHGGDWNLRGVDGITPAMSLASQGGKWMLGQVVRFHGADLSLRDDQGRTAADHALQNMQEDTLHAILGHLQQSAEGLKPVANLLTQAILTSPEVNMGPQEDRSDAEGAMAHLGFRFSRKTGLEERAKFIDLLSRLPQDPVLLEARDEEGNTPLILASATGQMDVVSVLLAQGANPNAQNDAGETALLHAVHEGEEDIVRLLRAAGAKTELGSHSGIFPRALIRSGDKRMQAAFTDPEPAQMPTLALSEEQEKAIQTQARAWDLLHPPRAPRASRRMAM